MTRPSLLVGQPLLAPLLPVLRAEYDVIALWDDPDPETQIVGRRVACAVGACWMRKQVLGFSRTSARYRSFACDAVVVGAGRPDNLLR